MAPDHQSAAELDDKAALVYKLIEQAAANGDRCPTNVTIAAALNKSGSNNSIAASSVPSILQRLVRSGMITIRIYGHNWRDICILSGPHAGKLTMPPPHGGKPHTIIDLEERLRRDKAPRW